MVAVGVIRVGWMIDDGAKNVGQTQPLKGIAHACATAVSAVQSWETAADLGTADTAVAHHYRGGGSLHE